MMLKALYKGMRGAMYGEKCEGDKEKKEDRRRAERITCGNGTGYSWFYQY